MKTLRLDPQRLRAFNINPWLSRLWLSMTDVPLYDYGGTNRRSSKRTLTAPALLRTKHKERVMHMAGVTRLATDNLHSTTMQR